MIGRTGITVIVTIVAGTWALVLGLLGWPISLSFFKPLSVVVGVLTLLLPVFEFWAWAWPGMGVFFKRPDVRGTWMGEIRSTWKHPDGTPVGPIKTYIVIHQTYSELHLRLFTQESESLTMSATVLSEPDGASTVVGVYRNQPQHSVRYRSAMHHGGLILRVDGPPPDSMSGHYWTDRKSDGGIELQRVSRERVGSYRAAEMLKPKKKSKALGRGNRS